MVARPLLACLPGPSVPPARLTPTPPIDSTDEGDTVSTSPTTPATAGSARRRPWAWPLLTLALLLAAVGAMVGLGEAAHERSSLDQLPAGRESALVAEAQQKLPDKNSSTAIVLFTTEGRLDRAAMAALAQKAAQITGQERPPVIPSQDGTAVMVPVTVKGVGASEYDDQVTALRAEAAKGLPAGVSSQVTGPAAIQTDLGAVFDGANVKLLGSTALVVAILLVFTYRSPVLWIVPLMVVGIADRFAAVLATHVLSLAGLAWDESTTGILSVLVFGAGTDYALLLISRYRDELRRHEDRHEAMRVAARRTVEPVLASSSTVFVGLMTLVLSVFPSTRGLGVACAVGVLVAAFFVLVALPGALVAFPRGIFWPRTPTVGEASLAESQTSVWSRVGRFVERRPGAVAVCSTLLLALGAIGLTQISTGLSDADQFLKKPEAIAAAERLAESYPAGAANPVVITTQPEQVQKVVAAVKGVEGVSQVNPTAQGAGVLELQAIVDATPGSQQSSDAVLAIREAVGDLSGTHVGGTEAQRIDKADGNARDRLVIFPVVLGLVFAALVLLLRSLVAPVVLVGTVLLTYVSALGLSWWVFGLLGFERMDGSVPLYAFVFLVALGVDYNIFLVTRASEEAKTFGSRKGMLRALTATGGVITSAGILLAAVFAVLGVLPLVVLAQLGVVIFIGVLLDTLVVRTVLVPSLALLLGDRFWWPRRFGPGEPATAASEQTAGAAGAAGTAGIGASTVAADPAMPVQPEHAAPPEPGPVARPRRAIED